MRPDSPYHAPRRISGGDDLTIARIYLSVISTLSRTLRFIHAGVEFFEHPEHVNHPRYLRLQIAGVNIPHETKNIIYRAVKKH